MQTDRSVDESATERDGYSLTSLEQRIGYDFDDRALLVRALTHRSFANEQGAGADDNEVLEFLGDAVLGLIVSDLLCRRYPSMNEGQMSKLKSFLVSAETLATLAEELGLGQFVILGRGEEKTAGRTKNSILANSLEALIAALYVDGGLERATEFVLMRVEPLIGPVADQLPPTRDFKSALQEYLQASGLPLPLYEVVDEVGPDHQKTFLVQVSAGEDQSAVGKGSTKKRAEQVAAKMLLEPLLERPEAPEERLPAGD